MGGGRDRKATGATDGHNPRRQISRFRNPPGFAYDTGKLVDINSLEDRYGYDVDELMAQRLTSTGQIVGRAFPSHRARLALWPGPSRLNGAFTHP